MTKRRSVLKGLGSTALAGLSFDALGFTSRFHTDPLMERKPVPAKITKIFDPADGFGAVSDAFILTDSTLARRGNRWWMYLAGRARSSQSIDLFSASLPQDAPLSAGGWTVTAVPDDKTRIARLAGYERSKDWDLRGGRHCPSYVVGWDPQRRAAVERIYYAGGATNVLGPYAIGYLEWDGSKWVDQPAPVFKANEDWERGSVYEPNLIYHDGKWRMWYVAGSNQQDYLVHGYSESADGRTNWSRHQMFFSPEQKVFDFCVVKTSHGFEAAFSRVWLGKPPRPAETGLWWCHAREPSSKISDWSKPLQIMTAQDDGWYTGPWKPSLRYGEEDDKKMFVFFDGQYLKKEPSPFPYVFTLGCLEMQRPE
ncbi:MAG TPA: hypothetical protein VKM94_03600 [Blastocatellia bacterium]|nr:hypothetical protein [Blastocatellia bacterium]